MKLDWPGLVLECADDGLLTLNWHSFCRISSSVKRCASVRLVPQGVDGAYQWIFQLRATDRATPGLVVVRVDVPAERVPEAEDYTDLLRRRFGVPDLQDETAEERELERIPQDPQLWTVTPTSAASEELFRDVMARIAGDTG